MIYQLSAFICISLGLPLFAYIVPECRIGSFYDEILPACVVCPQNPKKDCAFYGGNMCYQSCPAACILPKRVVSTKIVFPHGESTTFECEAGKILVGLVNSDKAVCDNGTWKYVENGKVRKVALNKVNCVEENKSWGNLFGG